MLNKIKLGLVALLLPLVAFAQSYPSPTFNNLTVQGTFTLSGGLPPASLASQAANTVLANVTASSASPTAVAMPTCNTSTSALQYAPVTGWTCYTNSASLTGATFTGPVTVSLTGATFSTNETSGTGQSGVQLKSAGSNVWALYNSTTSNFLLQRFVSGTAVDNPISVSNSTGVVTMSDGITNTPISGSTGSFTTLAASSTLNITGASTLTGGINGITTGAAVGAGKVGEILTASATAISLTNGAFIQITSLSVTAGEWLIWGSGSFSPSAVGTRFLEGISLTTASDPGANGMDLPFTSNSGSGPRVVFPVQLINISATTTYFVNALASFASGTCTANGSIMAVRIH